MNRFLVRFAVLLCLLSSAAFAETDTTVPATKGYVTRVVSPTDFDVDGFRILCDGKTQFESTSDEKTFLAHPARKHYLGQPASVFGVRNNKAHTIAATKVIVTAPAEESVSGLAIIDDLLPGDKAQPGERYIRADGYRIRITPKTKTTFDAPLASLTTVGTNVWIAYSGNIQADGTLVADTARFTPNIIPDGEDKLRTHDEYDTRSIDPRDKQSGISKYFLGTNVKKIPPYSDPAMQARIDRIGASLVPAYQRALPATDPTKLYFRFQLIDEPKWRDALALASGIILVPRQVVERIQNDSQLAAVLADSVAGVIEKQWYRIRPAYAKMLGAQAAADVGAIFIPGLGVAAAVANHKAASTIHRNQEEQSGRISLGYLHDAGYDILEAPKAWWLLASKKPKGISDIKLPDRAAYLYYVLGQSWRAVQ